MIWVPSKIIENSPTGVKAILQRAAKEEIDVHVFSEEGEH